MDDREYLRSLGFEVGARGRFSTEMKTALAERSGGESEESYKSTDRLGDGRYAIERGNSLPSLVKNSSVKRAHRSYIAELKDGVKVACEFCGGCSHVVMYCECEEGPQPPTYLVSDLVSWSAAV